MKALVQSVAAGVLAIAGSLIAMNTYMDGIQQRYPLSGYERERATALALQTGTGAAGGAVLGVVATAVGYDLKQRREAQKPKDIKVSDIRAYAQKQLAASDSPTANQFWLEVSALTKSVNDKEVE
jgi:hypothetical protein